MRNSVSTLNLILALGVHFASPVLTHSGPLSATAAYAQEGSGGGDTGGGGDGDTGGGGNGDAGPDSSDVGGSRGEQNLCGSDCNDKK